MVIAVTMAYLISDALWILLQPDMVMPSMTAGSADKLVKCEANRIPGVYVQQHAVEQAFAF